MAGTKDQPWPMRPGTVHPEHLAEHLADLRLHPLELETSHILPFVPDISGIDQEKDRRLESIARILCECTSIHAAATALIQLEPWDFMAVYYDAIDHFSHGFMRYHPPRMEGVSEKDFETYRNVIEAAYRYHDMMLGVLMQLAGEDTTVILQSDHGFHPDHLRPLSIPNEPAGPAAQHRPYGIFVMRGLGIRKDERVYGANVLDICPTILTLFGLPVGQDMDGKPLVGAFEEPPGIDSIPSWDDVPGEDGRHPPDRQVDPVEAAEAIRQLVDLGYIEKPDENREMAVAQTVRELDYNLARSYMDANRHTDAVPLLEKLLDRWPDELRFGIQLVTCYQALERNREARTLLEDLFARKDRVAAEAREKLQARREANKDRKPEELDEKEQRELRDLRARAMRSPFAMEYLMGSLLFAEGEVEEALKHLQEAEKTGARRPGLHLKIGEVYLKMKRWEDAERGFRRALEIDTDSAGAYTGLCRTFLPRRRNMEAAGAALNAVGLLHHNPMGHYLLGIALHRLGHVPRAVEALKVAVSQNPSFPVAHRRLAYIYRRRLKMPERAAEHQRLANEATKHLRSLRTGAPPDTTRRHSDTPTLRHPVTSTLSHPQRFPPPPIQPSTILIVSGLPRSGTSMMMQMLEAGGIPPLTDGKRTADEDNPRGYYEFIQARRLRHDQSWLGEAEGKTVKIVAQLLGALPPGRDYRVVFMERDLDEVIASQRVMLARQGKRGADLPDESLRRMFEGQVRQVKRMLDAREIPVLFVDYHNAVEAPRSVAARVNAYLSGDLNGEAMVAVVDPDLCRQRRMDRAGLTAI